MTASFTHGLRAAADWNRLAFEGWQLMAEANTVIALRTLRIMGGGKLAEREAERMVTEKWTAWGKAAASLATSPDPTSAAASRKAMAPVRRAVRSNRRRLGG